MIKYIKGDLFNASDYALAHCVSADFALGAGIAKEFNRRFDMRRILKETADGDAYWGQLHGYSLPVIAHDSVNSEQKLVFNLVTKQKYWQKPTLKTLRNALENMKTQTDTFHIKAVSIPKIGCGLDRLKWDDVAALLQEIFGNDVEITVYSLD